MNKIMAYQQRSDVNRMLLSGTAYDTNLARVCAVPTARG